MTRHVQCTLWKVSQLRAGGLTCSTRHNTWHTTRRTASIEHCVRRVPGVPAVRSRRRLLRVRQASPDRPAEVPAVPLADRGSAKARIHARRRRRARAPDRHHRKHRALVAPKGGLLSPTLPSACNLDGRRFAQTRCSEDAPTLEAAYPLAWWYAEPAAQSQA